MLQSLTPGLKAISDSPLRIVYSYAREDETFLDQLITRMKPLEQSGLLQQWHDRRTFAGDAYDQLIEFQMTTADVIVLMVSDDYAASTYVRENELPIAMARQEDGAALVIPVVVRPTSFWQEFPASGLQALPRDAAPVSTSPNIDAAWSDVANGIRSAAENWRASPNRQAARRRYRVVVGAASALLTLLLLQLVSVSRTPPPAWLHAELVPTVREVIRVTADLAHAGMMYIVHTPATRAVFAEQVGDLAKSFDAYRTECDAFSERSHRFERWNEELAKTDPTYALAVSALLRETHEHCNSPVQRPVTSPPAAGSTDDFRVEHDRFAADWTVYQIRSEAVLAGLREHVSTLEARILKRAGAAWLEIP